jgi:tetratricopeptide (TPR) repeat protein
LEIDPDNAYAWGNKGLCLDKTGGTLEALKYYEKSLEIDPDNANDWYNKGLALRKLGRYVDAKICFDKLEQLKSMRHHFENT